MRATLVVVFLTVGIGAMAASEPSPETISFEQHIRPILKAACFQCHGEAGKVEGGLDARLARLLIQGGDSGAAVVPGNAAGSLLYERVASGEMPEGGKPLTADQLRTIEQWINGGATTIREEPEDANSSGFTREESEFWAFQPVSDDPPPEMAGPRIQNGVDAWIALDLKSAGLSFSPEAERLALIRRAYFDLCGIPPTPEEVDTFLADESPEAYERLIDRLLATPQYGERWGRHWLDVAGFAESDGMTADDQVREFAYKYRDYVIRAFNSDKPLREFIVEQLAGDELIGWPTAATGNNDLEKLIATGFLRMAPDGTAAPDADQALERNQVIAETIKIVGTALLGLTVGCAQCHDHRYDPISQEDYYRLRAIFEPAFDPERWRTPSERLIDITPEESRRKAAELEAQAQSMDREIETRLDELFTQFREMELARVPDEDRARVKTAVATSESDRTEEQRKLLRQYPTADVKRGSLEGLLVEYDRVYKSEYHKELASRRKEVANFRASKPVSDSIAALTEVSGRCPDSHVFVRGDPNQPGSKVTPADLRITSLRRSSPQIPSDDADLPSSGRRLAYARMLTDGHHPLVSRVLANRIWLHHFGRGLVSTPGDFGALGDRPTNQSLLDWLATELVVEGWRVKPLHRAIMLSATYRQSSAASPSRIEADPENRRYSRFPFRRLEAEAIRDSILAVSDQLNTWMYGPSVPVVEDGDGQVVVGRRSSGDRGSLYSSVDEAGAEQFRRSVYLQVRRKWPLAQLEAFDMPAMNPSCELRKSSNVSTQSLLCMNSEFMVRQSRAFALRVMSDYPQSRQDQIKAAWRWAFQERPLDVDVKKWAEYVRTQTGALKERQLELPEDQRSKIDPELLGLASFCQAILCSNRFLYVD